MLDQGVVSPTVSSWGFPLVVVAKPGTDPVEQRLCVDLRKLNDLIETDEFPIPNIDDLLNSVRGCQFYSTVDLCSANWQLELTEESKKFVCFRTSNAHYQFNRVPFGLQTLPLFSAGSWSVSFSIVTRTVELKYIWTTFWL